MRREIRFDEYVTICFVFFILCASFPNIVTKFSELLAFINAHDGTAQVLVAITTAFFAYWIPSRYRKYEMISKKLDEIYSFNEVVVYHAALLEHVVANISRVREAYEAEKIISEKTSQGIHPNHGGSVINLLFILPLMAPDVMSIVSKIKNPGRVHEVILAYMRISRQIQQFNLIAEERGEVAKSLNNVFQTQINPSDFNKLHGQLFDLTSGLIMAIEAILDYSMFVLKQINEMAEKEKSDFLKVSGDTIQVCRVGENQKYERIRLDLFDIVNRIPQFNPRFLYLS